MKIPESNRSKKKFGGGELAESIKTLGLLSPITINSNNELISGWRRIAALKLLGNDEIDVVKKDFDPQNKKLLDKNPDLTRTYGYVNIMLNKAAEVTEITPWVKILNKEEKTVA